MLLSEKDMEIILDKLIDLINDIMEILTENSVTNEDVS